LRRQFTPLAGAQALDAQRAKMGADKPLHRMTQRHRDTANLPLLAFRHRDSQDRLALRPIYDRYHAGSRFALIVQPDSILPALQHTFTR
jgi:hypothetical protein